MMAIALLFCFIITICSCNEYKQEDRFVSCFSEQESVEVMTSRLEDMLQANPDDYKVLWEICDYYNVKGEYRKMILILKHYYEQSVLAKNEEMQVQAGAMLGQAYVLTDRPDSMKFYYDEIINIAESGRYNKALSVIYNALGLYNLNYANYTESVFYFQKAMTCAGIGSENYYISLGNIGWTYYLRNDSYGIKFSLEVYDFGVSSGNRYLQYIGALHSSYMYILSGEYELALEMSEKAYRIYSEKRHKLAVDIVRARIYSLMGKDGVAEKYFSEILDNIEDMDLKSTIETYLYYGEMKFYQGKYQESKSLLMEGIALSEEKSVYYYIVRLYKMLSETYIMTGHKDEALNCMNRCNFINDNVFNVEREKMFGNLRAEYEMERRDNELKKKEIEILNIKMQRQVYAGCIGFLLLVASFVSFSYLKKKKNYTVLVSRYESSMSREQFLRSRIEELESVIADQEKTVNDLKDERSGEMQNVRSRILFTELESIMEKDKIYRNKEISLKMISDILGTNKVYVSRMFNQYAGTTFSDYINSYRIREAITILSDVDNDIPLKKMADDLGYNSLSSMYRAFQKEIGVSPSRYREEKRKSNNSNKAV